MKKLYNALTYLLHRIENDTNKFLEAGCSPDILPNITIKYKNVTIEIPIDLAETNDFITATIEELRQLIKEEYI